MGEPDFDEINRFVDDLFRSQEAQGSQPVQSGDWRIDRIDQIIQDAYDEAIWWHNQRISEGADPVSGLHGLPYIPWDERIDGVAAMHGAIGGLSDGSYQRNGDPRYQVQHQPQAKRDGLTCGEIALIAVVAVACLVFMMVMS